jgi:hypothetical protein
VTGRTDECSGIREKEFFDTPELSASMIVDKSMESGGPGDGVLRAKTRKKKS